MPSRLDDILPVVAAFAPLFSDRLWQHAQLLVAGALLARGKRTVTACLRVMGLRQERRFANYYHVLSRAVWCAREGSRRLLGLIVATLLPAGAALVLGADDTIERRSGRRIPAKGGYRDAVRSSGKHVIRGFGLQWGAEGAGVCALLAAGRGAAVSVCAGSAGKRGTATQNPH